VDCLNADTKRGDDSEDLSSIAGHKHVVIYLKRLEDKWNRK
jgi:hypothetical protein